MRTDELINDGEHFYLGPFSNADDGMRSTGGTVNVGELADTTGNLDKREFVFHSTREGAPRRFSTRWAMSYLPGPLTRDQILGLMADQKATTPAFIATLADTAGAAATKPEPDVVVLADDESAVAPEVADGTPVAYLDSAADWAALAGASAGGTRLQPSIAARVRLLFDETKGDLRHEAEWESIVAPLGADVDGADFIAVDYDDRDLQSVPPDGAVYVLPDAKIHTKTFFSNAQRALKDQLYRSESLSLFRNDALELYSRVDETEDAFAERRRKEADKRLDNEVDELEELADALIESLEDAADEWDEAAQAIEPFEVGLEKTDITVEDFTLVWVPTSS